MIRNYRVSEAAYLLGVCSKTVRRWDALGRIECKRTVGGHRRISVLEIRRLLTGNDGGSKAEICEQSAIYCRVSSHEQKKKGDLERQIKSALEYCRKNGYSARHVFKDVGSGLNTKRGGLKKMCRLIEKNKLSRVVVPYPDRLTRFGLDYIHSYFKSHGTTIEIINKKEGGSMEEELVQDLIAIITSFSGRVHGMRSHRNRDKNKNTQKKKSSQMVLKA